MDESIKRGRSVDWLTVWILFSSWCSLAGWLLSAFGCLNELGYTVAFAVWLGGMAGFRNEVWYLEKSGTRFHWRTFAGRWVFPKIWLALTMLILLGGLLYHPSNYDYLTYRFPRVLNWCWEQGWFWIDTINDRMNLSGTGIEWLMAPLFIYFKTDRLFFLINFVSFLLLPGLIFSVFASLGISKRVCWWWMWVLPSGCCYVLQAGSAANDLFAGVYLLASLRYALARDPLHSTRNLALSCLAIALVTGAKTSNIPLALPWLIALFLNRGLLFSKWKPSILAGTLVLSVVISFVPVGIINDRFTGSFSGDPTNHHGVVLSDPVRGIIGNSIEVVIENLAPPIWMKPISWAGIIPQQTQQWLRAGYPRVGFEAGEMRIEEAAGIGLGVTLAAALMIVYRLWLYSSRSPLVRHWNRDALWIAGGCLVAVLAYMAKLGSEAAPRLLCPYYLLMIGVVAAIASLDGAVMKRSLWTIMGSLTMASAFVPLVFSPARPLIPVLLTEKLLSQIGVPSAQLSRFDEIYRVYSSRFDALGGMREYLSPSENSVGFVGADDPEVALWIPFGSRRVFDLGSSDTLEKLDKENIHSIVVSNNALAMSRMTIDDLTKRWGATLVMQKNLLVKAHRGEEIWYLIHR